MKLLIINPNISEGVTKLIEKEAVKAALPNTSIKTLTAPLGVAYIETFAEAAVATYVTLDLLAQNFQNHDAAIIAAFGDPGLIQAKEILPIPVVGLTQSALASAFLLGGHFAIVGISERLGAWYDKTVEDLGMTKYYLGYRGLGEAFSNIATVQEEAEDKLVEMCLDYAKAGADTIILAGAPLAGLARNVTDRVPIPLVDGVGSAVRMAETLVRSQYHPRKSGALSPPPKKPHTGMPKELSKLIGRI